MNAPVKGWNAHTLATIRLHASERSTRTAAMVLACLASESVPAAIKHQYTLARLHTVELASLAIALVESRDASVFGNVAESAPAPANEKEPDEIRIHEVECAAYWNSDRECSLGCPPAPKDIDDPIPPTQPSPTTETKT